MASTSLLRYPTREVEAIQLCILKRVVTEPSYAHVTMVVCAVRGLRHVAPSNSLSSFVVNRVFQADSLFRFVPSQYLLPSHEPESLVLVLVPVLVLVLDSPALSRWTCKRSRSRSPLCNTKSPTCDSKAARAESRDPSRCSPIPKSFRTPFNTISDSLL